MKNWYIIYFFINFTLYHWNHNYQVECVICWKNIFGDFYDGSRISDRLLVNTVKTLLKMRCHRLHLKLQWISKSVDMSVSPPVTRTDARLAVRPAEGPNLFHCKKVKLEVLPYCTEFHKPHVVLDYAYLSNNIIAMKALPSATLIINI